MSVLDDRIKKLRTDKQFLEREILRNAEEVVAMAFEVPFDQLPNHINDNRDTIRAIVKYRLARGI